MSRSSPTVLRRQLSRVLRQQREVCGLKIEEVANELRKVAPGSRWSPSKLSRIENAAQRAQPSEVEDLLDLYGISGEQKATLIRMSRQAGERGWWQPYNDVIPDWFHAYVDMEGATTSLRTYEAEFVPGLLQTEEYYQAVLDVGLATQPESIGQRLEVRRVRQQLLSRDDAPELWVILNEAVLHRPIGGMAVMRDQLDHLATMAKSPNLILQVLPFRAGAHVSMTGSFTIMRFPAPNPDLVYLENLTSALYLEQEADLDRHTLAFGHLQGVALNPVDSIDLIKTMAAQFF